VKTSLSLLIKTHDYYEIKPTCGWLPLKNYWMGGGKIVPIKLLIETIINLNILYIIKNLDIWQQNYVQYSMVMVYGRSLSKKIYDQYPPILIECFKIQASF
jgi:hypothetical protein